LTITFIYYLDYNLYMGFFSKQSDRNGVGGWAVGEITRSAENEFCLASEAKADSEGKVSSGRQRGSESRLTTDYLLC